MELFSPEATGLSYQLLEMTGDWSEENRRMTVVQLHNIWRNAGVAASKAMVYHRLHDADLHRHIAKR